MYECSECQDEVEIPEDCSNEELFLIGEDWFIDDGAGMNDRSSKNKRLFHMCYNCRYKNKLDSKSPAIGSCSSLLLDRPMSCRCCDRCWKDTPCGVGKWNENRGHIHCCTCGNVCYECHGLLHYNK